jgi:hypothetical protein
MSANVAGIFQRGKTFYGTAGDIPSTPDAASIGLEGTVMEFPDIAPGQGAGAKVVRSGLKTYGVILRNAGASTVAAKTVVVFETGYFGKRHNGASGTAVIPVAGVVDPHLSSAGCRVGDLCWVFFKGPCEVLKAAGDVTQGNRLVCTNDGKAAEVDATPDNDAEAQDQALNALGTVMTTTTTDPADCLAYLDIRW